MSNRLPLRRPPQGTATRSIVGALVVVLLLAGAGWWYYTSGALRVSISKDQILERLGDRLPYTRTYLFIFEVTFDQPSLALDEVSQRITAGLDVSVNITLLDDPNPLRGHIDATAGIDYNREDGSFYLRNPAIDTLEIEGLPINYLEKTRDIVEQGVASYFKARPIYTLTERQSHRAAKAVLQDVSVESDRLILQLAPP